MVLLAKKKNMPNKWRTVKSLVHKIPAKFDFTVDEGEERLNPFARKIKASNAEGRWRNPVTFLLCDPSWYVHKSDVQNKCDDDKPTHTHLTIVYEFSTRISIPADAHKHFTVTVVLHINRTL